MGQYFGGDVVGGADDLALLGLGHLLAHAALPAEGESEVDEHDVPGEAVDHHEVLELEVAVGHLLRVHVAHRAHHLPEQVEGLPLREYLLRAQPVVQLPALAVATSRTAYSSTSKRLLSSSKVS